MAPRTVEVQRASSGWMSGDPDDEMYSNPLDWTFMMFVCVRSSSCWLITYTPSQPYMCISLSATKTYCSIYPI